MFTVAEEKAYEAVQQPKEEEKLMTEPVASSKINETQDKAETEENVDADIQFKPVKHKEEVKQ